MKLLSLTLSNFKGIKSFEMDIGGKDVTVFGDNATGKTTICDAIYWLLFDKDSQFRKQFDLKTLDKSGAYEHGLNYEVEGAFMVDGNEVILKKIFSEKWTKKRGDAKKSFTGNTTDYFVDGVPVKKKEYTERTSKLFDEEIFKLLTTPTYFSETLPWQKRRDILLEICGDVSIDDIINSDSSLGELSSILKNRSIEDHKKIISSIKTKINNELEKIPVRIDEVNKGIADISEIDENYENTIIIDLEIERKRLNQELITAKSGGIIADKTNQLMKIDSELFRIENNLNANHQQSIKATHKEINAIALESDKVERSRKKCFSECQDTKTAIETLDKELEILRQQWFEIDALKFIPPEQENICPTCGQEIPESMKDEAIEKAQAEFNISKSERLADINQTGSDLKASLEKLKNLYDERNKELESIINKQNEIQADLEKAQSHLKTLTEEKPDYSDNEYHTGLMKQQAILRAEIETLDQDKENGNIAKLEASLEKINDRISESQLNLIKVKNAKDVHKRIDALKDQERKLSEEFEKNEKELFMIESFIRKKVELIEEKVNGMFELARFKLFEEQINGGLNETCQVTYDGVPFESGLNHGHRILVGIDIIKVLNNYYGRKPFILVDNRESLTAGISIDSQVISFVVSEKDKKLRVETKEL